MNAAARLRFCEYALCKFTLLLSLVSYVFMYSCTYLITDICTLLHVTKSVLLLDNCGICYQSLLYLYIAHYKYFYCIVLLIYSLIHLSVCRLGLFLIMAPDKFAFCCVNSSKTLIVNFAEING